MAPEEAPLLLVQICSAWRRLALSIPDLWASLHIVVPSSSRVDDLAVTVTSWLSRSGVLPLSISLTLSQPTDADGVLIEPDCDPSPVLAALAVFSSRWKNIRMVPWSFSGFEALTQLSLEDVPLLQALSVGSFDWGELDITKPTLPWRFLSILAKSDLRRVTISSGYNFAALRLPWATLTHLKIIRHRGVQRASHLRFTIHDAREILQKCPLLEDCQLDITNADDSAPVLLLAPVYLPHLRHLGINKMQADAAGEALFARLVPANLRSLKYSSPFEHSNDSSTPHIFYPPLERLSLSIVAMQSHELLLPNDHFWSLGDPNFLSHLKPNSEPVLCPNLRHLRLSGFSAVSDNALVDFIQSRTSPERGAGVARLEYVDLLMRRSTQHDITLSVQPALADGLQLSLDYQPAFPPHFYSPWEGLEWEEHDFFLGA
ncbi:hypothetical protein DFH09DRAFT_1337707 [Mycena vulgaris]|nr:hypothetical protein DFH09DRAFT_1337707 [Mycena vulgaris]